MPGPSARCIAALTVLHAATCLGGDLDPGPEHLWVGNGANCNHDDIQEAIDDASATRGAVIHIVGAQWNGIGLVVQDKDITLQGGHVACLDDTLVGRSVLSNTPYRGLQGSPVLGAYGDANVTASRIEFVNGGQGNATQHGGGIVFEGSGTLALGNVAVRDNVALDGGGIAVTAVGGPALLWLLSDTRIVGNEAQDNGGGIHLAGEATLRVHAPGVSIAGNTAGEAGGGIAIVGGAHALIASGGDDALVDGNLAARGGGIAVFGDGATGASSLRVFSIDANEPTVLRANAAWQEGGAIHAGHAYVGDNPGVQVCVSGARFEDNWAPDGAIVQATRPAEARGGGGTMQPPTVRLGVPHDAADCPGPNPVLHGAVACQPGVPCNRYTDNTAADPSSVSLHKHATPHGGAPILPGSLLTARRGALLLVSHAVIDGNAAFGPLLSAHHGGVLRISDSVIADNVSAVGSLLHLESGGNVGLLQSTVADNMVQPPVAYNLGHLVLADSILDVGTSTLLFNDDAAGATVELDHVLASNVGGVPDDALFASLVGTTHFVDRAAGNYRLTRDSVAIDFAPASAGIDLDGIARSHDAPRANRDGTRDLGAYEWTPGFLAGRVFGDGFDDAPSH